MTEPDRWSKWARNGRLATIVWGVTFIAWLAFKIAGIPLEALDTVFVIMSGLWAGNLGISTHKQLPKSGDDDDA